MQQYTNFFVDPTKVYRVKLESSQWVEIKSEMSIGDWEKFENSLLQIEADTASGGNRQQRRAGRSGNSNSAKYTIKGGMLELLTINIVNWSFEEIPVSTSNIEKLNNTVANLVLNAIDERNPTNPLESGPQDTISSTITPLEEPQGGQ